MLIREQLPGQGQPHPPEGTALRQRLFAQSLTKNKRLLAVAWDSSFSSVLWREISVVYSLEQLEGAGVGVEVEVEVWRHNLTPLPTPHYLCSDDLIVPIVLTWGGTIEISAVLAGVVSDGVWLLLRSILIKSTCQPSPHVPSCHRQQCCTFSMSEIVMLINWQIILISFFM